MDLTVHLPALQVIVPMLAAPFVLLLKPRGLAWAGASLVSLAVGVSTLVGLANTIVQERSPAELRGRVSAVAGLSFFGFLPFAAIIMAVLHDMAREVPAAPGAAPEPVPVVRKRKS